MQKRGTILVKYFHAWLRRTIEEPWTTLEPFFVGEVPKGLGTPEYYCVVTQDEEPYLLVNAYTHDIDVCIWKQWLVLRSPGEVSFISLDADQRQIINKPSWGFFHHLYPTDEYLFVTTNERVCCYDQEARLVWESEELSQDTISISSVQGDIIGISQAPIGGSFSGPAEFILDGRSGKLISMQYKPPQNHS